MGTASAPCTKPKRCQYGALEACPFHSYTYQVVQDLIPYDPAHLEALLAPDRVHNHVPMYANEMLAIQDCVLVLARRVNDLCGEVLIPIANDFAKGVLDGGVVGVDEVAVDILDGERALACAREGRLALCMWRVWCFVIEVVRTN